MNDQLILLQLKQMPENLKQEVLDFINFLMAKHNIPEPKPQKKKSFAKYRGSLHTGLTVNEIDQQLQQNS